MNGAAYVPDRVDCIPLGRHVVASYSVVLLQRSVQYLLGHPEETDPTLAEWGSWRSHAMTMVVFILVCIDRSFIHSFILLSPDVERSNHDEALWR